MTERPAMASQRLYDAEVPAVASVKESNGPQDTNPERQSRVPRSFLRSVSSGYDSMEECFNNMDHDVASNSGIHLPNDVSSLFRGSIVGKRNSGKDALINDVSPRSSSDDLSYVTTPELFARGNCIYNYRGSSSVHDERSQLHKRSSLSKVRSCLFPSPKHGPATKPELSYVRSTDSEGPIPMFRQRQIATDHPFQQANNEGLFKHPLTAKSFKRSISPVEDGLQLKRKKVSNTAIFFDVTSNMRIGETVVSTSRPTHLQRSLSAVITATTTAMSDLTTSSMDVDLDTDMGVEGDKALDVDIHAIAERVNHGTTGTELIGDFSKPWVLPVVVGNHDDLKSISATTLAALIRGEFNDLIGTFKIVDCRYPYEFDAGHIQGAVNLYSKDLIKRILLDPMISVPKIQPDSMKRNILVFHCEFSLERGPNLLRFLRNLDRGTNATNYPALHYPEVYLLKGGYKRFYKEQRDLCIPQGYCPMKHPNHYAALRQFRCKSKTWQGETSRIASGFLKQATVKRLDF